MKPDPTTVLDGVSATLIVDVVPHIGTSYGQQAVAGAATLTEAAEGQDGSLMLADIDLENRRLRALLLRLHVRVEDLSTEAARRVEAAIWSELRASTERRKSVLGNF